jgi:hypothetical protein
MTIAVTDLVKMTQAELDRLYKNAPVGAIPNGDAKGAVISVLGFPTGEIIASTIELIVWQGKVFNRDRGILVNKVTPFGLELVEARVYRGKSWLCEGESIILDYSRTSFIAQQIRDEIREVAPGIYLGNTYWGQERVLNFTLEFS